MTPNQARIVLGIDPTDSLDEDDLIDVYEEQVFENARFFLNRAFLPKLAKARIKKVEQLELAYEALGGIPPKESEQSLIYDFQSETEISDLISSMLKVESEVKLKLSQAQSGLRIIEALNQWIQIIQAYAKVYFHIFEPESKNGDEFDISISKGVDYAVLLSELKHGNREVAEHEYWRLKKIV